MSVADEIKETLDLGIISVKADAHDAGTGPDYEKITLLAVLGVPGVLAIMIIGSICARYVIHGAEQIPPLLENALGTIVGFYFGAGAAVLSRKQSN